MPTPPPPRVPDGWKPEFDDRYQEWYFVNLHTGRSQWDRPDRPAQPDGQAPPPSGPPPSYEASAAAADRPSSSSSKTRDRQFRASPRPPAQAAYGTYPPQPQYGYKNNPYPQQYAYPTQQYPTQQYPAQYGNQYPAQYDQQPPRTQKKKKGMGKMGAAALGVGGGLLGGLLLGEGIEALEDDFDGPPGPDFGGGGFDGGFGPF